MNGNDLIQTYNENSVIAVRLTQQTGSNIITIAQSSGITGENDLKRKGDLLIKNTFVKALRCRSRIVSVEQQPLPDLKLTQSQTQRIAAMKDWEYTAPRKQLNLHISNRHNDWMQIASVTLLNIPPYRITNLMEYYTENIAIELGSTGAIGVSLQDVGWGYLQAQDEVVIYGSITNEIVSIPANTEPLQGCQQFGWTINSTSQPILSAALRKQLTLVNTGEGVVYISFGMNAEIGKGITLMPNGGSYELNKTTYPYTGVISAVSDSSSYLTALECY